MSEAYCIAPRGSADVSERKRTKQKLENTKKKFALDGSRTHITSFGGWCSIH